MLYNNRALWFVKQLWVTVPVNPWKNRASSELLYKCNRPQVSMGYRPTNHLDAGRTLEEFVNAARGVQILLVFYQHPTWFISFYKKLDRWIMQFESFHWLSHHGIWAIIPCSTNIVSKRVILGRFYSSLSLFFYILGAFLIKKIIPFALFGYGIGHSQLGPTGLVGYLPSHIQRALME